MTQTNASSDETSRAGLGLPSWIVLVLLAVTPFLFATGFSQYEAVKQYVLSAGVGLALIVWGVQLLRRGRVGLVAGRVSLLLLSFGLYVVLSIAWGARPLYAAVESIPYLALVGLVFVMSAPLGRRIRFFDLSLAVAVGAGASGLTGLLDAAGVGVFTPVWDPPGATGVFDAMEVATAYYAVAIPLTIGALLRFEGTSRYTFGFCFLLATAHMGLVADWWAVGLLVGAGAAVGALILAYEGTTTVLGLYPAAILLGFVVLFKLVGVQAFGAPEGPNRATSLPVVDTRSLDTADYAEGDQLHLPVFDTGRLETGGTMQMRGYLLDVGWDLVRERPLIGRGSGAWWRLQTKHPNMDHPAVEGRFRTYPAFRSPHNGWITIGVAFGGVGLALFLLWLISVASVGLGALDRETESPDLVAEQWGFWTTVVAGGLFVSVTPLLELAPAAAVWFGTLAFTTIRSAEINGYQGASVRWQWTSGDDASMLARSVLGGLPILLGAAMLVGSTTDAASALYRGYADHLMLERRYERALEMYQKADRWYPERGAVLYNVAVARWELGSLKEAEAPLERAAEMRPYDSRILTFRSRLHLRDRDYVNALRVAKQAVNHHPNGVGARQVLVGALSAHRKYEAAATQLQKIIERRPPVEERVSLHLRLGQIYRAYLQEYDHAEDHYKAALEEATTHALQSQIQNELKKLEKARKGKTGGGPRGKGGGSNGKGPRTPPGFPNELPTPGSGPPMKQKKQ